MLMPRVNLNDFRNFSVQLLSSTGWVDADWAVSWDIAAWWMQEYRAQGYDALRIYGHHKTATGGAGNRIVWDSREA